MSNKQKIHEPLFHISKRASMPWYFSWLIRLGSILAALIVSGAVTMLLTHQNPISVYATMIDGAFGTSRRVWNLLQSLAILLCVALALTPAFKMRFWNIGGEGQVLVGGLATAACMICLGGKIPNALLILVMIIASMLAGAIWAVIPAVFKANFNTNETLFTLMMNYVGIQLVSYFVMVWEVPKGSGKIGIINQTSHAGWLPQLGNYEYLLNILIVLVLTIFMYIYLKYSKHGYELSVVGESENTAKYIGINVKKVIIEQCFFQVLFAVLQVFFLLAVLTIQLPPQLLITGDLPQLWYLGLLSLILFIWFLHLFCWFSLIREQQRLLLFTDLMNRSAKSLPV